MSGKGGSFQADWVDILIGFIVGIPTFLVLLIAANWVVKFLF